MNIQIENYHPQLKEKILIVWENSVLATHHFLKTEDFAEIKKMLQDFDFMSLNMFCLFVQNQIAGFIGVHHTKIEMLFLDPKYFGQGLGRRLLNFAIEELNANQLDVNEQNINALKFYQKFGFVVFERTDQDDQGRNYPLLRMRLVEQK